MDKTHLMIRLVFAAVLFLLGWVWLAFEAQRHGATQGALGGLSILGLLAGGTWSAVSIARNRSNEVARNDASRRRFLAVWIPVVVSMIMLLKRQPLLVASVGIPACAYSCVTTIVRIALVKMYGDRGARMIS